MKKFIVYILLLLLLNGCSQQIQPSKNGGEAQNNLENVEKEINDNKIDQLNRALKTSKNEDLDNNIRETNLTNFTDGLLSFLKSTESVQLSDHDYEQSFDNAVSSLTKVIVLNNSSLNVRVICYQAPLDIKGTLENHYTFIQWWSDNHIVHAQMIHNGEAETPSDFILRKMGSNIVILMGGRVSLYSPNPTFVSLWELTDEEWKESQRFNDQIITDNFWICNIVGNELIVENQEQQEMDITPLKNEMGFLISSEAVNVDSLVIKFNTHNQVSIHHSSSNLKVGDIAKPLDVQRYAIDDKQSFTVNLEGWENVRFVSTSAVEMNGNQNYHFFLLDNKGNVLYEFPQAYKSAEWNGEERVVGVAFKDVNNDGLKDVIIIANYNKGKDTDSFPVASIYFQLDDKSFTTVPSLNEEINENGHNKTIHEVIQYVSTKEVTLN